MILSKAQLELIESTGDNPCDWLADQGDGSISVICTYPPSTAEWPLKEWLPRAMRKLSTAGHAFIGLEPNPQDLEEFAALIPLCPPFEICNVFTGPTFKGDYPGWRVIFHVVGEERPRRVMPTARLWAQMHNNDPAAFTEALVLHAAIEGETIVDLFAHDWPYIAEMATLNGIQTFVCS